MKSYSTILGLLVALVSLNSCRSGSDTKAPDTAYPVIVSQVAKKPIGAEVLLSGAAAGRKTVRLGFMVGGKVSYIAAEEGSPIAEGQLLASLDSVNYGLGRDIADAGLHQVQDEHRRLSAMYDQGSLSASDFEKISSALKQAQAQQQLAAKNLADTRLYAPISGVLLRRMTEPGEIVAQGMPLFVLAAIDTIKVEASVPESDLRKIKLGQRAAVRITALDTVYDGRITQVGAAADPISRSYTVEVSIDNPQRTIRPGMLAEVRIALSEYVSSIVLSGEAVLRDADRSTYVYVLDAQKCQVFRRAVTLGRLCENDVEILSGLSENELVVTGGQHRLHDGSTVKVEDRQL